MVSDLIESHSPVFLSAGLRFVFQLKCKNSAHLDEKKNRPKFDIEWLCSKVFIYLTNVGQILGRSWIKCSNSFDKRMEVGQMFDQI